MAPRVAADMGARAVSMSAHSLSVTTRSRSFLTLGLSVAWMGLSILKPQRLIAAVKTLERTASWRVMVAGAR